MSGSAFWVIIATFLSLAACQQQKPANIPADTIPDTTAGRNSSDTTTQKSSAGESLVLNNFTNLPEEVHGCACYFSGTETEFKNNEYLFAASFDSVAFISVNNQLIRLTLRSTQRTPGTFGDHDRVEVYTNENYKVTADIKYVKAGAGEVWWNTGTLTIEAATGGKTIRQFVGECGC